MDLATFQKELGMAIRRRREAMNLSQEAFADAIKMHRAYYSAIERGERNVTLHTVLRVANGLRIKAATLFTGIDG